MSNRPIGFPLGRPSPFTLSKPFTRTLPLGCTFQIPPYLQQTFIEAYRRQADPRLALPSKGAWVNLTA